MIKRNGFTLIEVLVYLALFGLLFAGLLTASFPVMDNIGRNDTGNIIHEEGVFLLAKISRALDTAALFTIGGGSVLNIDAGATVFEAKGGNLEMNGMPLNGLGTRVEDLEFIDLGDGKLKAVFSLTTRDASGRIHRRYFSDTYYLE